MASCGPENWLAAIVFGDPAGCHRVEALDSRRRMAYTFVHIPYLEPPCPIICTTVNGTSLTQRDAATVAINVRRHMARAGLTFEDVVTATELDERTVRGIVRGTKNPHARTLHKLANGLGVTVDDLFQRAGLHSARQFDRVTNSLVSSFVNAHPDMFHNWSEAEFDELYSRFGTGGQLTEHGIAAAAQATNVKRNVWRQVSVILESGEAKLLTEFIELLYGRVTVTPAPTDSAAPS